MIFDSLALVSAAALFAAAIATWRLSASLRAGARRYLRFAAVLFTALAICVPLALADVAALFALPLAGVCLMLAALARFARPLNDGPAAFVLLAALGCGFGGLLSGLVLLALMPVMLAGLVIAAVSLNRAALIGALSGAAQLAAGLAYLRVGAGPGVLLLCAAALIGLSQSSAFAIEQARLPRRSRAISLR